MIAQELEVSLHMAFVEARQQRHEFITVEHLLLALLDNPSAAEVLRACSANVDDLRKALSNFIKDNTPQVAGTDDVDTQPTLGFQRVIQRAIMHVQSTGNGKKEVTGANVLVAIFGEKDSQFNGLADTLQRMSMFACGFTDLINLCSSDIFRKHAAYTLTIKMDFEHDLRCCFTVFVEKLLNHHHHKLHRRVVVIKQNHLKHLRWLGFLRPAL